MKKKKDTKKPKRRHVRKPRSAEPAAPAVALDPIPPVARRADGTWAAGVTGNPRGRPRRGRSLGEQLRKAVDGPARSKIIRELVKRAEQGDLDATKLVLNYTLGAPPREPLVAIDLRQSEPKPSLDLLSVAQLRTLREILEIAQGKAPPQLPAPVTIDAETVPATSTAPPASDDSGLGVGLPTSSPPEQVPGSRDGTVAGPEPRAELVPGPPPSVPPKIVPIRRERSDLDVMSPEERARVREQRNDSDLTAPSYWRQGDYR